MAELEVQTIVAPATSTTHQCTIAAPVTVEGVGLHTGRHTTATFHPAEPRTGVVFVRTDLPGAPRIPAHVSRVLDANVAPRRTAIGDGTAQVHTIEHAMAALWGLGIDNVRITMTGQEVPGLDGSAQPFVDALQSVGIREQSVPRNFLTAREPIWIEGHNAAIAALPHPEFRLSYTLSYDHPMLKAQFASFNANVASSFIDSIAPARTFCLEREANQLRELGLGMGANYDNTLVVGDAGVLHNELRFHDEFVRHKVLDLLGDLYLLGGYLKAHVIALKSGHALNIQLVQRLQAMNATTPTRAIPISTHHAPEGPTLDITAIQNILPHRYPFLLVDRIVELEENKRAVGIKNVTINEQFFQGHFPGRPVMPGVLLLEAMAQVGGILILKKDEHHGKYVYFMSADKVKFRKAVVPGDQLTLTAEVERFRGKTGHIRATATVHDTVMAEALIGFVLVDG